MQLPCWNEGVHEKSDETVRAVYPNGLGAPIAEYLRRQPGIASVRMDSQGKAFAQMLLDHPVPIPADLALANIHLDVLLDLLDIPEFLNKDWYIFSGILGAQAERFLEALAATLDPANPAHANQIYSELRSRKGLNLPGIDLGIRASPPSPSRTRRS